jgi:hypothetical protein
VHEFDPNMLPDSEFEPGAAHHLVAGNEGRLLDPRRTPVRVVEIRPATGMFVVRIEKFEDTGALWEVPFEQVTLYQFSKSARRAANTAEIDEAIARFNRPLRIDADLEARPATLERIRKLAAEATVILSREDGEGPPAHGGAQGRGIPRFARDDTFTEFLGDLAPMDAVFARQFVSNPYAGETVKGHRIVLAELGLVAYHGRIVRDPELFFGDWSRPRRAEHIVRRLAFVQALYRRLGFERVWLYRGLHSAPGTPRNHTFVSASFEFEVAKSHMDSGEGGGVLYRQLVPVERLFMTWRETPVMNERFREMEAVLLYNDGNPYF